VACLSWQAQHATTPSTSRVHCARIKLGPLRSCQACTGCGRHSACAWLQCCMGGDGAATAEGVRGMRIMLGFGKDVAYICWGIYWARLGHNGPHIFLQTMSISGPLWCSAGKNSSPAPAPSRCRFGAPPYFLRGGSLTPVPTPFGSDPRGDPPPQGKLPSLARRLPVARSDRWGTTWSLADARRERWGAVVSRKLTTALRERWGTTVSRRLAAVMR
jgi:hypothetical protein